MFWANYGSNYGFHVLFLTSSYSDSLSRHVPPAAWTQTGGGLGRFSLDQQIHDLSGWLTDALRLV